MAYKDGPYLMLRIPNEETGQLEKKYASIPLILNSVWEDYKQGLLTNDYTRELLMEIGFNETQVFHMLEILQAEKADFDEGNYREVSYL